MYETKPSVLNQLKSMAHNFHQLVEYEKDVSANDLTDAIFYSKLEDQINSKIKEIETR